VTGHAVIGYVHGGLVRAEFCASLLAVCMEGRTPVDAVLAVGSGPNISTGRNMVVRNFLGGDAPWLFMCDTDMVFGAGTIDQLVEAADPADRPVVGALCWSQNPDGGDPYPTMYELTENDAGELAFIRYKQWPPGAVVRVTGTGAACLLMHRTALETVAKHAGDEAAPWFRESSAQRGLIGEDLTFCLRCAAAGIPVHVATGVTAGHMKVTMLGGASD
jgi:GT2 family glycosyltransferase